MSFFDQNRRALLILGAGLASAVALYFAFPESSGSPAGVSEDNSGLAVKRLARVRELAAALPAREAMLNQAKADLAERERGVIQADTAAQGQAALLEIARRVGKTEQLDVRAGEFGAPLPFGDYGLVFTAVSFEGHVEQIVNFLADLSRVPELVVPLEEHLAATNGKEKMMSVRIVLAGVVARKLVPEKKGLASF